MSLDYLSTTNAPAAIGPYSQAVRLNGIVYTSGQVALDPGTCQLVEGDFEAQAHRVFKNLGAVLASAGLGFEHVLKANVYLTDLGDFATLNAIYASYFGDHKPARTTVQVSALPRGARVEIDLTASK